MKSNSTATELIPWEFFSIRIMFHHLSERILAQLVKSILPNDSQKLLLIFFYLFLLLHFHSRKASSFENLSNLLLKTNCSYLLIILNMIIFCIFFYNFLFVQKKNEPLWFFVEIFFKIYWFSYELKIICFLAITKKIISFEKFK